MCDKFVIFKFDKQNYNIHEALYMKNGQLQGIEKIFITKLAQFNV